MSETLEKATSLFSKLCKIPTVTSGRIHRNRTHVSSVWSQRDLDKGKSTKFGFDYILNNNLNLEHESLFGIDVTNELLAAVSPSGKQRAVIRELTDSKSSKKQHLEVWASKFLTKSIDLSALDIHGDIYADSEFGSLSWNHNEDKILFIAEKKKPKSEPFIKRQSEKANGQDKKDGDNIKRGEEYIFRQEWGEQLVGKSFSVIVTFDISTEKLSIASGLPESWCPGQVIWNADNIIGVAWDSEPRRLGLKFCTNRPSCIFQLRPDGSHDKLSEEGMSVMSPRISPNGSKLFWLQRTSGGPHHAAHQLVSMDLPTSKRTVLISIVKRKLDIVDGEFYGLYCLSLPLRCFARDGKVIVFSTPQRLQIKSFAVEIESGKIWEISYNKDKGSTTVLDVNDDLILAAQSSLTNPSQLLIGRLASVGENVIWKLLDDKTISPVPDSEVHYLSLEHKDSKDPVKDFYAIYFGPKQSDAAKKLPLVLFLHGGPHSCSVDSYGLEYAFFNSLGFALLLINYRGSIGNGDDSVRFLPTGVGSIDVVDCKLAADEAIKNFPVDGKRVILYGGSHGGFLVTHLSGQYPDAFVAVSTRNPVIDLASFYDSSDIPDWSAIEAGGVFTEQGPPSEQLLLAMRRCSPLVHVHKVKAPTAIMLGSVDKRVPYYQGLEYYHRLRANGCKTKIFVYEDNHSLSSLPVEVDNVINSALWFFEHIGS